MAKSRKQGGKGHPSENSTPQAEKQHAEKVEKVSAKVAPKDKSRLSWDGLLEHLAATGAPIVLETTAGARVVVVAERTFLARGEAAEAAATAGTGAPAPSAATTATTSPSTTGDQTAGSGEATSGEPSAPAATNTDRLTKREIGILALVASGKSGTQVAADLSLAPNTVAQHLVSVRRKLGVSTTAAAIEVARESGLL
jgi:DNA-binding NarL/FixJ family response regulator